MGVIAIPKGVSQTAPRLPLTVTPFYNIICPGPAKTAYLRIASLRGIWRHPSGAFTWRSIYITYAESILRMKTDSVSLDSVSSTVHKAQKCIRVLLY